MDMYMGWVKVYDFRNRYLGGHGRERSQVRRLCSVTLICLTWDIKRCKEVFEIE